MRASMFRFCVLALLLVVGGRMAVAADAVITLKAQADVPAREFTLGDIALVDAPDDEESAAALRRLTVGQVGSAAGTSRFSRDVLVRYVGRRLPAGLHTVQWQGADAVLVELARVDLDPAVLVDRAAADLQARLEQAHTNVELRVASRPDKIRLPAGEHALHTRLPHAAATQPQRRMRVDVDVRSAGRLVGVLPIWFEVRAHAPRWVARRDLAAGHVLRADDVEQRAVDVAGTAAAAIEVTGLRLRRPVQANAVLLASSVEDVPWVSRQDEVSVEVRSGAVVVESRGIALSDGRAGEWVAVRVPGSELLRGRVVGPKRLAL